MEKKENPVLLNLDPNQPLDQSTHGPLENSVVFLHFNFTAREMEAQE